MWAILSNMLSQGQTDSTRISVTNTSQNIPVTPQLSLRVANQDTVNAAFIDFSFDATGVATVNSVIVQPGKVLNIIVPNNCFFFNCIAAATSTLHVLRGS